MTEELPNTVSDNSASSAKQEGVGDGFKKPSRSEIEDAVAGVKRNAPKINQANANPNAIDIHLEPSANRRQQVIGGDLTGISRRGNRGGWADRIREVNFVNLIAIGIVLAILAVFFWPTGSDNIVREISTEDSSAVAGYQGVERTDEPPAQGGAENTFSRDNDLDRATEFRLEDTQQRQISLLLGAAQQHIASGEYSQPPGNNAVSRYRQILQIDSSNRAAQEGLEFVRGRFLTSGLDAIRLGDIAKAELALQKIEEIEAESDEGIELANSIQASRTAAQISGLLSQARQAKNANQLILPARANALYFYQQVAELDSNNEEARKGILSIADEFVNKANAAVIDGELQAATGYLATVSVIDSKHPSIPLIESMIANAEPIASKAPTPDTQTEPRSQPTVATTLPKRPAQVSNNRTPSSVAKEREAFDRQYLQRGLDAYYRGNYEQAAGLLQPLADKGVARAQFRIAYMHYLGRGFEKDRTTADEIIRAALPAVQKFADEGRGWAQSDIGSLYEDGLVLARDYAEAIYWYRSAAEQGYPGAQTNLGVMYARGLGVTSSRKTAVEWFQRAAKQGDIAAKRNLEAMGITP